MTSLPFFSATSKGQRGALLGLIVWGLANWLAAAETNLGEPLVNIASGTIRGRTLPGNLGQVFRGVPFAQPPVDGLRWREPMPVQPWDGVRDAKGSGPPAAQAEIGWNEAMAIASREDCLYLDVWTPVVAAQEGKRVPVMVWLHGGGNVGGAGGFDPLYEGESLISRGVVLVVVEYRLGILGFFSHPELTRESPHHASGNQGLLDQIAALQWVRDNIAKFGGDPDNVTLFGQSAGSFDVIALLGSPRARGLFHRAIAESGSPAGSTLRPLAEAEQEGLRIADRLEAPLKKPLGYLRELPFENVLKAQSGGSPFVADGWVFPTTAKQVVGPGGGHHVPLIIGSNAHEFPATGSLADLRNILGEWYGDLAGKAEALYRLKGNTLPTEVDPLYGDVREQIGGDRMRAAAIVQGEWHAAGGNAVWEYEFARAIPPRPQVGHSSELPYVFGNLYSYGSQGGAFTAEDRKLSETMQTYWTNFAKYGDPNGPGLPAWPAYDGKGRKFLRFTMDAGVEVAANQRGVFTDFYREWLSKQAGGAR